MDKNSEEVSKGAEKKSAEEIKKTKQLKSKPKKVEKKSYKGIIKGVVATVLAAGIAATGVETATMNVALVKENSEITLDNGEVIKTKAGDKFICDPVYKDLKVVFKGGKGVKGWYIDEFQNYQRASTSNQNLAVLGKMLKSEWMSHKNEYNVTKEGGATLIKENGEEIIIPENVTVLVGDKMVINAEEKIIADVMYIDNRGAAIKGKMDTSEITPSVNNVALKPGARVQIGNDNYIVAESSKEVIELKTTDGLGKSTQVRFENGVTGTTDKSNIMENREEGEEK